MKALIISFILTVVVTGCQSPQDDQKNDSSLNLEERIEKLKEEMYVGENKKFNRKAAFDLVQVYEDYAKEHPDDSLAPEYFFKAGKVAMGLNAHQKAISLFQTVYKKYPDYEKRVESLFMQAFIYDNHLDKDQVARKIYEQIIDKYPDHPFADDAEASIQYLGMSDEELIQMFEDRARKKAADSLVN